MTTGTIDAVDAIAIYVACVVVIYVVMDVWEDFFK